MNTRRILTLTIVTVAAMLSTGCATRYQDLLRDRDMEIRELQGQLADARAELERRRASEPTGLAEASLSRSDDELIDLRDDLDGLDVDRRDGRLSITIDDKVTFDSGSAELKNSATATLRKIADALQKYRGRRIFVAGHTDSDPIKQTAKRFRSNRHLSVERADAVARWLVSKGSVPESEVVVMGFGPFEPRDSGSSDAAKARNRRVEIQIDNPSPMP